ncbi:venom peptide MmKTx1-like [Centruroides sculpturatus]|uniref:venom peptide MmKTx1-like n=1 Tax=Centruroides sculpturatus TaxID=218467 RepID=UPI000C6EC4A5|nr:venom peptide MmKTx1-like [Centruroides sculpturatus]
MIYLFLICLVCVVFEVNGTIMDLNVPGHKRDCTIKGKSFKPGEEYMDEQNCELYSCKAFDNGQAYVDASICSITIEINDDDGTVCYYKKTTGKYPDCCNGKLECTGEKYETLGFN